MPASTPIRRRLSCLVAVAGAALLAVPLSATAVPATQSLPQSTVDKASRHSARDHRGEVRTVAEGLDNPRQLSVGQGGALYVAESGRGGTACTQTEQGQACLGLTGAVTRVAHGRQHRVVTGLPSLLAGEGAVGPADVVVQGKHLAVLMGLGGNAQTRAALGPLGARFGTLLTGRLGGRLHVAADLAAYESAHDPDKGGADSNPVSLLQQGRRYVVADAGGNDVLRVHRAGVISTVAVWPTRDVPAPPFLGLPPGATIPMEAVPTGVAKGPDGAYYVSQLTGFPFPVGGANIWRVVPGSKPTVYASGLTNVTDLAWSRGRLYAVQLADTGLLSVGDKELPKGSLRRVIPGASSHPAVAGGLEAPYGVAVNGRTAYVTTCSVCVGGGKVQAIPLR